MARLRKSADATALKSKMLSKTRLSIVGALALLASAHAAADSMAVPTVELREELPALYVLETQIAPMLAPGARRPVVPDRCSVANPERADEGRAVRLSYTIDCGDDALAPQDVIVLPWVVDGIQLTAEWADGTSRRALFGREQVGVVVRLHLILDREDSFGDLLRQRGSSGWKHAFLSWIHWLFVLGLVLAVSDSLRRASWGLGGFVAGHAVSLVLAELGLLGLPAIPAEALLAGTAMLLMAESIREGGTGGLPVVTMMVGTLHGLGTATELSQSGVPASKLVSALFLTNSGIDVGHALMTLVTLLVWRMLGAALERRRVVFASSVGTVASVLFFATLHDGWTTSKTRASAPGFMEVDALATAAPVSAASIAAPPVQLDAAGKLNAPFMSYLVIEPYQIRHEVLVSMTSTREWLDVVTDDSDRIPVEAQDALRSTLSKLIAERNPIVIDGMLTSAASSRADFVSLGPTGILTREKAMPEPLATAIVGVTLVYETESIAESVDLEWGLLSETVSSIPLTVTDPLAVAETELSPETSRYEWRNTLGGFELPKIEAITAAKPQLPLVSLGLGVVALVAFFAGRREHAALACLVAAYLVYPFARVEASIPIVGEPRIDREEAARVTERLLTNVYRCFDIHNEAAIYDRLALTVTGKQLLEVYLESRRALELENRGGARVRIDEVVVREIRAIRETAGGGYELDTLWTVGGSVNHFGHVHFRQNRYDATITVVPVENSWKIQGVELLEEKRVL